MLVTGELTSLCEEEIRDTQAHMACGRGNTDPGLLDSLALRELGVLETGSQCHGATGPDLKAISCSLRLFQLRTSLKFNSITLFWFHSQ